MRLEHYHYWHAIDYIRWDLLRDHNLCQNNLSIYCQRHHLSVKILLDMFYFYEQVLWDAYAAYLENSKTGADHKSDIYSTYELTAHITAHSRAEYYACMQDLTRVEKRFESQDYKSDFDGIFFSLTME